MTYSVGACPRCDGAVDSRDDEPRCVNCGWSGDTVRGSKRVYRQRETPRVHPPTYEGSVRHDEKMRASARELYHRRKAKELE